MWQTILWHSKSFLQFIGLFTNGTVRKKTLPSEVDFFPNSHRPTISYSWTAHMFTFPFHSLSNLPLYLFFVTLLLPVFLKASSDNPSLEMPPRHHDIRLSLPLTRGFSTWGAYEEVVQRAGRRISLMDWVALCKKLDAGGDN